MKRPNLIYLIIALQCAICIGLGAVFFGIEGERAQMREIGSQFISEQSALRDQLIDANADIVRELAAFNQRLASPEVMEECSPSPDVRSVFHNRVISEDGCTIESYERRLQQITCTNNVTNRTRQYNQVVSDWSFVERTTVC